MNLYDLHTNPESLVGYNIAINVVPSVAWETYFSDKNELKKRIHLWSKNPYYAYIYAKDILKGPFPEGEAAIAQKSSYAYWYANDILHEPFPEGEEAISRNAVFSYFYAKHVLNGRFPAGEDVIAKHPEYSRHYQEFLQELDQ